jgi:hypothetical protein
VYRADLGLSLGNLGWALAEERQFEEASEMLDEGIVLLNDALRANPDHTYYAISLRNQLRDRGRVAIELRDHVAAATAAKTLSGLPNASGNDQLAAACLIVRAAGVVETEAQIVAPKQSELLQAYYDEAANWIRSAAVAGVSDATLLTQSQSILQAAMGKDENLREACKRLFPPAVAPPVSANP